MKNFISARNCTLHYFEEDEFCSIDLKEGTAYRIETEIKCETFLIPIKNILKIEKVE